MKNLIVTLILAVTIFSCRSYRSNIMFEASEGSKLEAWPESEVIGNYKIAPEDRLAIDVYTGKGERLIDPERMLVQSREQMREREEQFYLVQPEGIVDLPMIGKINLNDMTLPEASDMLEEAYSKFYKEPYVLVRFVNKRVTVLGASGGQVINLENERIRVTEVLAMAGGLEDDARAGNIRLIRGESVRILDLTTVEGYKKNNVIVEPGDIIYVEPVRRPFNEFLRENGAVIGIMSSVISLVAVIISLDNNN